MLTLQQALDDQKDLESLCQIRLEKNHEVFPENDFYGFANAMKEYAGFPVDIPIFATFPHGMYLRDKVVGKRELLCKLKTHLCYPPSQVDLWKRTTKRRKIVPFAAPIHYVLKQFRNEVAKEDRRGTLFVPIHGTPGSDVLIDNEAAIAELLALPEKYHPFTLCVGQNDIELGQHKYYQKAGFDVVCAGHYTDSDFISRWLHLASQFKLIVGAGIGSSLFYSILLGTPYYLIKQDVKTKFKPGFNLKSVYNKTGRMYSSEGLKEIEKIKTIFSELVEEPTKEQVELVDYYTQTDLIKTRAELLDFFNSLREMEEHKYKKDEHEDPSRG